MFLFPKWDISVHWRVSSTLHLLGLRLRGIGHGRLELLLVERVGGQGIFQETKKTRCRVLFWDQGKLKLQVIRSNIPHVSKCPNPKKKIKHLDSRQWQRDINDHKCVLVLGSSKNVGRKQLLCVGIWVYSNPSTSMTLAHSCSSWTFHRRVVGKATHRSCNQKSHHDEKFFLNNLTSPTVFLHTGGRQKFLARKKPHGQSWLESCINYERPI